MSWLQTLHATYEKCADAPQFSADPPMPIAHTRQQAHIEVVLDSEGAFLRADVIQKEETMVPATEESAGRARGAVPHALCDKIQYCAGDYRTFGGEKDFGYPDYVQQLESWTAFASRPKLHAILAYVKKATLVRDLVNHAVLHVGPDGTLLTMWPEGSPPSDLFRLLTPDAKTKQRDQGSALVRWRVQIPGDTVSAVWEDKELRDSWIQFSATRGASRGLCLVSGEVTSIAVNHPKRIRHSGDFAKLLSSNDKSGYTFRGRFKDSDQAYSVGSTVSQKAHNALRWLINRQAYRSGDQVYVAWALSGTKVPDPFASSSDLFAAAPSPAPEPAATVGDIGQRFSLRLKTAINGYRSDLPPAETIALLGLNSATPGRMAVTYYREMPGQEFLDRIADWHETAAWPQDHGKERRFIGAPAPRDIAEAAYGRRLDDKLRVATVERLLPCIIDSRPIPRDLVHSVVRRACNRVGLEVWEWNKALGVACALLRGSQKREAFRMSLEENRSSRDYLYGRLLAIAENIEDRALHVAKEKRETTAAKLMQRFSSHPCATWRNIELALIPYKRRLRSSRPAVLLEREKLLDAVIGMFHADDFIDDAPLTGEFLLGYHCQRAALWQPSGSNGAAALPAEDKPENGATL